MFDTQKGIKIFNDVPTRIYDTLSEEDVGVLRYYFFPRLHERGFICFDRDGKSADMKWKEPICRSCGAANCREQFDIGFGCKYCNTRILAKKPLKSKGKRLFSRFKSPEITKQRAIVEFITTPYKLDGVNLVDITFITKDEQRHNFRAIANFHNLFVNDVGTLCYADTAFKSFTRDGKSAAIYKSLRGASCPTCGAVIVIDRFCTGVKCRYCNNVIVDIKYKRKTSTAKKRL